MLDAPCTFLDWDSQFFGRRLARVNGDRLDGLQVAAIQAWCREHDVEGLYFLARADDVATTHAAQEAGWRLFDVRTTFRYVLEGNTSIRGTPASLAPRGQPVLRAAIPSDFDALRETARTAYSQSRFFRDPRFGAENAARLFEVWLQRSLLERDFAEAAFVAELGGQPAGFVSCHFPAGQTTGTIGLVGVSEAARGQSVGRHLVEAALNWFREQGARQVDVTTQLSNLPAQRLYERCGFVIQAVGFWYHWWREPC